MKVVPEITSKQDIDNKLIELDSNQKLLVFLLGLVNQLKTKLTLDLSPNCEELGKNAGFMVDCRDKLINGKIKGLVDLIAAIEVMKKSINPENTQTNSDFNKIMTQK